MMTDPENSTAKAIEYVRRGNARASAMHYLGERTGTLEYRFQRYAAVADELEARGLDDQSMIVDLGGGAGDFDFYMRSVRGFKGRYLPVDAAIDGTDLVTWEPPTRFEYGVCMEVLEHLPKPGDFVARVWAHFDVFVATTPHTDELGSEYVMSIDRTHISPVYKRDLAEWGAKDVKIGSFFGKPNDSLLAVWE